MRAVHILLPTILTFAIATLWVRERWAVCVVEVAVYLCTILFLALVSLRRAPATVSAPPLLLAGVAALGAIQLAFDTTAVRAETRDAVLYWGSAACFAWLGQQVCASMNTRIRFLKAALAVGASVCVLGVFQLFTSDGQVFWLFSSGYGDDVIGPFVSRNNYAAFVELLLPIALVLSVKDRRRTKAYLIVAGALLASVITSGSRAGTAIVVAETAVVLWLQIRRRETQADRRWLAFAGALTLFVLVAGHQALWERFNSGQDPLQFRREFVQSSAAMVRDQPLHGFGLGTWPWAYRRYAIVDTGFAVNHAHNEWVQWAAEGGLPAVMLLFAVGGICVPGALRSVWGVGILAVFVHALVDYPFMRLGLAAWVFTMMGALSAYGRERRLLESQRRRPAGTGLPVRALSLAIIPVFMFGVVEACRAIWADHLFRLATPESVARAALLRPDRAEYAFTKSWTDRERAISYLRRAVAINPYLTEAAIPLASLLELHGDHIAAEAVLLETARHDHQYAPSWALANLYFRTGQFDQFWPWARKAAAISPGHLEPLFDLCFFATNDASIISDRVIASRRPVERDYLRYLIARKRLAAARLTAFQLVEKAGVADRLPLLDYVDSALAGSRFDDAAVIWNALCARGLLPYAPLSGETVIDGDMRQPILGRGFDWQPGAPMCATPAFTDTNGPALELFLNPDRPDQCELYYQFVYLQTGRPRVLRFQYRTSDLPDSSGLHWSIGSMDSHELRPSPEWTEGEWRWPKTQASGRLKFIYRRSPGSTRREGVVFLRHIRLETDTAQSSGGPP